MKRRSTKARKPAKRAPSEWIEQSRPGRFGDGWIYRALRVACGKRKCRLCHGRSPRHGPYWYATRRLEPTQDGKPGRVVQRYIGAKLRPLADVERERKARRQERGGKPRAVLDNKGTKGKPAKLSKTGAKPAGKPRRPEARAKPAKPPADRTRPGKPADLARWRTEQLRRRIENEAAALQAGAEAPAGADDGPAVDDAPSFTFAKTIPADVRELIQGEPFAVRALVRAVKPGQPGYAQARGRDYFAKVGEARFLSMLRKLAGGRAEQARAVVKQGQDSAAVLAALLVDRGCAVKAQGIPSGARFIRRQDVRAGDTWQVCGVNVRAVCDGPDALLEIGRRRVPISAEPMPVDPGTFKAGRGKCRAPAAAPAPF